jgi:hypothetical protein
MPPTNVRSSSPGSGRFQGAVSRIGSRQDREGAMSYRLHCDACGAESDATDASWTHIEVSRGLVKRDVRKADICLQCDPKLRELLLFA